MKHREKEEWKNECSRHMKYTQRSNICAIGLWEGVKGKSGIEEIPKEKIF